MENKLIVAILVFVVMDIALLAVYVQKEPGGAGGVWHNISIEGPKKVVSENFRILLQGSPNVNRGNDSLNKNSNSSTSGDALKIIDYGAFSGETPGAKAGNVNENRPGNPAEEKSARDWMDVKLRDVSTGREFSISDFKGKPILLENFELWCPACNSQQNEMKKLRAGEKGSSIIFISLGTGAKDDETKIKDYMKKNGFDWYFAIAPPNFTVDLLKEFGTTIAHPPSAPVLLICSDQSTKFLERKLKSDDYLLNAVESGC